MKLNLNTNYFPVFGTTSRRYTSTNGDEFGCNSWLFRDDIDWKKLSEYEIEHFKDKNNVNTVMFAASDGSEAYTKIISLMETDKNNAKKFFPIKAYDVDPEILKAAQSGLIRTNIVDRVELHMNCANPDEYFEASSKELQIADEAVKLKSMTYRAKESLSKMVNFSYGDMFKKVNEINDSSNTILMCRNILGYFDNNKIESFIKSASENLKKGSLFVIGDHDSVLFNIKNCIEQHNFKNIMKNVFQKL